MPKVELVHWNPRRRIFKGPISRRLPISGKRVKNFGDLLGPRVVQEMLRRATGGQPKPVRDARLVSIGSVMHLARDGDVIWGTGINGKHMDDELPFKSADFRAVRGPHTHEILTRNGHSVPEVFGDPGLLVGELWPSLRQEEVRYPLTIIPNLNDLSAYAGLDDVLDPRSDLDECLLRIAQSEFVIGSSLHAIIVAESLGVPARLIASSVEPSFKYDDYYAGSGRGTYKTARSVSHAIDLGGEGSVSWDPAPLLNSFPYDLWTERSQFLDHFPQE